MKGKGQRKSKGRARGGQPLDEAGPGLGKLVAQLLAGQRTVEELVIERNLHVEGGKDLERREGRRGQVEEGRRQEEGRGARRATARLALHRLHSAQTPQWSREQRWRGRQEENPGME